ncbi:N-acetyltransferase [bacterium]|nr:N-acetyltransferase [bacterium]
MIRRFMPSDMEQVLSIWLEASIKAHDFVAKEFWESKMSDMRNVYIPNSETYVFSDSGSIKGFLSLSGDVLAAIFVTPGSQGQGIGQQLMDKAKSLRNKLTLTVYRDNHKSVEFYKKNGFVVVRDEIDKHTGHAEILMAYEP